MITNDGKNIIAKFLLGHTTSYASHMAIGCGSKPLSSADNINDFAATFETKKSLDFEMFRVPITSRGYVKENDSTYVVFTAEMPTTERYGITEIGVFSAGSNPEAGVADSRMLAAFSDLENWEQHDQLSASAIPLATDIDNNNEIDFAGDIANETKFFRISSDNVIFAYPDRISQQEVPRFLDSSIVARGDSSDISVNDNGNLIVDESVSSHIHLTGVSLNLEQNSPADELLLAFSLVNRNGEDPDGTSGAITQAQEIRIILDFASGEGNDFQSAKMEIVVTNSGDIDFATNRYFVVSKQLQELVKTIGFAWENVTIIKAYACVLNQAGQKSNEHYIAFDGLRIENKTDIHPLYGLTGYSVVKNDDGLPIIKPSNSNNFVEFRFGFQLNEYS